MRLAVSVFWPKRSIKMRRSQKEMPVRAIGLSTPFHKYDHVCCVAFRFWLGATREHPPSRPVGMTEEQQRQNRKATQPCGRRFFSAQTSLLAPYSPLKGMRVARASSGPKIPRRKRGRIYEMGYLASLLGLCWFGVLTVATALAGSGPGGHSGSGGRGAHCAGGGSRGIGSSRGHA